MNSSNLCWFDDFIVVITKAHVNETSSQFRMKKEEINVVDTLLFHNNNLRQNFNDYVKAKKNYYKRIIVVLSLVDRCL